MEKMADENKIDNEDIDEILIRKMGKLSIAASSQQLNEKEGGISPTDKVEKAHNPFAALFDSQTDVPPIGIEQLTVGPWRNALFEDNLCQGSGESTNNNLWQLGPMDDVGILDVDITPTCSNQQFKQPDYSDNRHRMHTRCNINRMRSWYRKNRNGNMHSRLKRLCANVPTYRCPYVDNKRKHLRRQHRRVAYRKRKAQLCINNRSGHGRIGRKRCVYTKKSLRRRRKQ